MPDSTFDCRTYGAYIRSFETLRAAVSGRAEGQVAEIDVTLPSGSATIFLEKGSLYIIGFRGAGRQAFSLKDDANKFPGYIKAKLTKETVVDLDAVAKYEPSTWGLEFTVNKLADASGLGGYRRGGAYSPIKEHIDRLAFAIAEAARFIPIRCAVACVLAGDDFLAVLQQLARWSKSFIQAEKSMPAVKKGAELSPDEEKLRKGLGGASKPYQGSVQMMTVKQNDAQRLTGAGKWLSLLEKLGQGSALSPGERGMMKGLRANVLKGGAAGGMHRTVTLGDFRALMTNWETLSLFAAHELNEPELRGLLGEVHRRYCASSTPAFEAFPVIHWT